MPAKPVKIRTPKALPLFIAAAGALFAYGSAVSAGAKSHGLMASSAVRIETIRSPVSQPKPSRLALGQAPVQLRVATR